MRDIPIPVNGKKIHDKFKMADFLLGLGHGSKRLFCTSGHDTFVFQVASKQVKRTQGADIFYVGRGRCGAILPRPCTKTTSDYTF